MFSQHIFRGYMQGQELILKEDDSLSLFFLCATL